MTLIILILLALVVVMLFTTTLKIIRQQQVAIVERLGKFRKVLGLAKMNTCLLFFR